MAAEAPSLGHLVHSHLHDVSGHVWCHTHVRHDDDDAPAPAADAGRASDGRDLAVRLDTIDPVGAEASALVELAALWSKVIAWATARRGEVVSVLAQHAADVAKHAGQDDHWEDGRHAVATELAMSEGTTRQSAERLVRSAVLLNGMLLATGSALEAGTLSPTKADVIVEALAEVPYSVAWAVEEIVLPHAGGWTPPELARKVQQALIEVDPHEAERRARNARGRRRVCHPRVRPDGMASIFAVLPAGDALAVDLALDNAARAAKQIAGETRTMDQLRADLLAGIGTGALATGVLAGASTPPVPVRDSKTGADARMDGERGNRSNGKNDGVHGDRDDPAHDEHDGRDDGPDSEDHDLADGDHDNTTDTRRASGTDTRRDAGGTDTRRDADTSLGSSGVGVAAPGCTCGLGTTPGVPLARAGGRPVQIHVTVPLSTLMGGDEPGHLDGYGALDAATSRTLAWGGTWKRLVTDPLSGTVLDVGRTTYRPPAALADLIRARDRTCVRPGCATSSRSCQLDHLIPWEHDGQTSLANLAAECPQDHRHKTLGDFTVNLLTDGAFEWTSRLTGRSYRREVDGVTHPIRRLTPPDEPPPAPPPWSDPHGPPPF